eukprot:CAMPEP_0204160418 /NCGR_PEP_ID=MMETSP0361-20130328/33853_1 /ASSEMBLY_ACC=CAM_ASM_000343 /TAXON_ID=268821 /ORGANISM="Scrippsiella Hangoei, Strain SHTV-5" /LENGTH=43 /DNA_ID= /DNA_START= /DNA_END= /DNA_ORIENTATION=
MKKGQCCSAVSEDIEACKAMQRTTNARKEAQQKLPRPSGALSA